MSGVWALLHRALYPLARLAAGRKPDPTVVIMDGQSVKTAEQGGVRGFDGHKRVKGRKCHVLVDILGLPIANRVEPANMSGWRQIVGWARAARNRDMARTVAIRARTAAAAVRASPGLDIDWIARVRRSARDEHDRILNACSRIDAAMRRCGRNGNPFGALLWSRAVGARAAGCAQPAPRAATPLWVEVLTDADFATHTRAAARGCRRSVSALFVAPVRLWRGKHRRLPYRHRIAAWAQSSSPSRLWHRRS
jgi:hypothetical protein